MNGESRTAITRWLQEPGEEADEAKSRIFDEYFVELLKRARLRLSCLDGSADQEDVAQSAMKSFFRRADDFTFGDRDDIWRLLCTILHRKICKYLTYHNAQKRDANRTITKAGGSTEDESGAGGVESIVDKSNMPENIDRVLEMCADMINLLPSDLHKQVAQLILQGYTQRQIAEKVSRSAGRISQIVDETRETWTGHGLAPRSSSA